MRKAGRVTRGHKLRSSGGLSELEMTGGFSPTAPGGAKLC